MVCLIPFHLKFVGLDKWTKDTKMRRKKKSLTLDDFFPHLFNITGLFWIYRGYNNVIMIGMEDLEVGKKGRGRYVRLPNIQIKCVTTQRTTQSLDWINFLICPDANKLKAGPCVYILKLN